MIDFSIFDSTSKIILTLLGLLIAIRKIIESFASHKRKSELKTDLEILEKLKENNLLTEDINNKIQRNVKNSFRDISHNFLNFFMGLAVFCGFGSWTIDLLNDKGDFNPWSILTSFLSAVGLALIFNSNNNNDDQDDDESDDKTFVQIQINDKFSFILGLCLMIVFGVLTFTLISQFNVKNHWTFVSGLTSLIGIVAFAQCIKRIK